MFNISTTLRHGLIPTEKTTALGVATSTGICYELKRTPDYRNRHLENKFEIELVIDSRDITTVNCSEIQAITPIDKRIIACLSEKLSSNEVRTKSDYSEYRSSDEYHLDFSNGAQRILLSVQFSIDELISMSEENLLYSDLLSIQLISKSSDMIQKELTSKSGIKGIMTEQLRLRTTFLAEKENNFKISGSTVNFFLNDPVSKFHTLWVNVFGVASKIKCINDPRLPRGLWLSHFEGEDMKQSLFISYEELEDKKVMEKLGVYYTMNEARESKSNSEYKTELESIIKQQTNSINTFKNLIAQQKEKIQVLEEANKELKREIRTLKDSKMMAAEVIRMKEETLKAREKILESKKSSSNDFFNKMMEAIVSIFKSLMLKAIA